MVGSKVKFEIECVIRVNVGNMVCLKTGETLPSFPQELIKKKSFCSSKN